MSYTRRSKDGVFEILVREHEAGLLAFVRSCVDDDAAADDLVQETFLAAWRQLDRYDTGRPFARWLRGIARNKILEYFRSAATAGRHVRPLTPEMLEAIAEVFEPLTGVGDGFTDCLDALRGCLHRLQTTDHDIIRSVYLDGQTCGAIASRMGRNTEVIKKRLQRARALLRDCIIAKLGLGGVHG
jgi:RNA polymerase sigma-70 factor, ECF subfamily